jgi:pilus assembly protein CpaF
MLGQPLAGLWSDADVTDVLVNADGRVWFERDGQLNVCPVRLDAPAVDLLIERIFMPLGIRIDPAHPLAEGRLADGSRVSAAIPPVAAGGGVLSLRRFRSGGFDVTDFATGDLVSELHQLVEERANVVVFGPTGSGKSSLLTALARLAPAATRFVVLEDTAELCLGVDNVVSLEAVDPAPERTGIDLSTLVRAALRMRPDRIVVGEVRGPEAADLLWALSTGHRGSLSTVHAGTAGEALERLVSMAMLGSGHSAPELRRQWHRAVDAFVGVQALEGGRRQVVEIRRCSR